MASTPKGTLPEPSASYALVPTLESGNSGSPYNRTPVKGAARNVSNNITELGDANEQAQALAARDNWLNLNKAAKSGDTFTGNVVLPAVQSRAAIDTGDWFLQAPGGNNRWAWLKADPESTGNAGSNLALLRYSDAGTYLGIAMAFNRASGAVSFSGPITRAGNTVWDSANDGPGSGLDADLLDGLHASAFALASALGAASGIATLNASSQLVQALQDSSVITAKIADGAVTSAKLATGAAQANFSYTPVNRAGDTMTGTLGLPAFNTRNGAGGTIHASFGTAAGLNRWAWILTGSESGSNTGSDVGFARYNDAGTFLGLAISVVRATGNVDIAGILTRNSNLVWDSANDGPGSGLDADLLDGLDSSAFLQLSGAQTVTGAKDFNTIPTIQTKPTPRIAGTFSATSGSNAANMNPGDLLTMNIAIGSSAGTGKSLLIDAITVSASGVGIIGWSWTGSNLSVTIRNHSGTTYGTGVVNVTAQGAVVAWT